MANVVRVTNAAEPTRTLANGATTVEIVGTVSGTPSLNLPPGVGLRGGTLKFTAKGLNPTSNNSLSDVRVATAQDEAAIFNDTSVADFGTLALANVTTIGQIHLVTDDQIRAGRIIADDVTVEAADVRGRFDRPNGDGTAR